MRPIIGIAIELVALSVALTAASMYPLGGTLEVVAVLALQVIAAFLIHCPAHYLVGSALGIRFSSISVSRSGLVKGFPPRLAKLDLPLPTFHLSVSRKSRHTAPTRRLQLMFASGAIASITAVVALAVSETFSGSLAVSIVAWLFALVYLSSEIVLSTKAGDFMRARSAGRKRPAPVP